MNKWTWLSLPIITVMLVALCGSAALAQDHSICPAGYLSTFNANQVGCTFCAADSAGCEVSCIGSPTCYCEPGDAACCAATPCCTNCPKEGSLECNVSSCGCEPSDCCFTRCPEVAPALGAPKSTPFAVAAGALAIAGVVLIRRRRRLQRQ
jgi:hypothetical protein